ncbi:MAG: hypothetical protein FWG96_05360 [Methanomassiliicoccaceae archaeon]|nr:hypothetical protein [Methanomassiliicoccaceae archaeon]
MIITGSNFIEYLNAMSEHLSKLSEAAGVTPHNLSKGHNREDILVDFFNYHLPRRLKARKNVIVIDNKGNESNEIDIAITNDIMPDFSTQMRMCIPIESVAGTISVKTKLDKKELFNCLDNIKELPQIQPEYIYTDKEPTKKHKEYLNSLPKNYIFAYDGIKHEAIIKHIERYYTDNHDVPLNRRPVHTIVNGKYSVSISDCDKKTIRGADIKKGHPYRMIIKNSPGTPFAHILNDMTIYTGLLATVGIDISGYFEKHTIEHYAKQGINNKPRKK